MQMLFWNAYYSSFSVIIIYTMPLYGCSNRAKGCYGLFSLQAREAALLLAPNRMFSKTKQTSIIT